MGNIIVIEHLQGYVTFAARFALGMGVNRNEVAEILEAEAHAIRHPADVAESTTPITLDDLATLS